MHREALPPQVVAAAYRAAAGVQPWNDALQLLASAFEAWQVVCFSIGRDDGRLGLCVGAGPAPATAHDAFALRWEHHEPLRALATLRGPGVVLHCDDHLSPPFVATHPFYQDYLAPHGARWVTTFCLHQDRQAQVFATLIRSAEAGPLSAPDRGLLERLVAHLCDAMALFMSRPPAPPAAGLEAEVLRRLHIPALLVDVQAGIHARNGAAQALLDDADGVRECGGRLALAEGAGDPAGLQDLLQTLAIEPAGARMQGLSRRAAYLQVARRPGRSPLGMHISALRSLQEGGPARADVLALVMLHDPQRPLAIDAITVGAAFDLTRAQARVAAALGEGLSSAEIAVAQGVAVSTVRSHVRAVMTRLGVRRQAEVVGALARLPGLWLTS